MQFHCFLKGVAAEQKQEHQLHQRCKWNLCYQAWIYLWSLDSLCEELIHMTSADVGAEHHLKLKWDSPVWFIMKLTQLRGLLNSTHVARLYIHQ